MVRRLACAAFLLPVLAAAPGWSQIASPPQILGPLVGPGSIKAQPDLAFFGTDLGWTVEHQGQLRILFGDTDDVFNAVCFPQLHNDDSQGTMPLKRPDTGVPPVTMLTAPGEPNVLQRLIVTRDGESLTMGYGQVPVSAYSDGKNLVAIMGRGGTIRCKPGVKSPVAACRGPRSDHPDLRNWLSADGLRCSQTGGRVRSRAERNRDRVRARDRRRLQRRARRDVPAHGERAVRGSLQLAERRHAELRALHRGERDGVRHRGPGPPRPLRVARDAAHQQVHQHHRRARCAVWCPCPARTATSRGTRSSSGAARTSRVSRAARRRSTCWRIRCRSRAHGTGAGASAPGSTPASTCGTDRRAGRGSRRERSRSRSTAWSAAARSRSSRW